MELTDEIAGSQTAYMLFTLPSGETNEVPVREAEQDGSYYIFKCGVAAKNMDSAIKAQVFDGNGGSGTEYTYSVREYAEYLLANAYEEDGETVKVQAYADAAPLVRAMLRYGEYAANYFSDAPALEAPDVEIPEPEGGYYVSSMPEGVVFKGATLSLKSMTTLSLYFTSAEELEYTARDEDGNVLTCDYETKGTEHVIRIRNIPAASLLDEFEVEVRLGEESGTVIYSPMTYCYKASISETAGEKLKNTVKALYNYAVEADEYFNEPTYHDRLFELVDNRTIFWELIERHPNLQIFMYAWNSEGLPLYSDWHGIAPYETDCYVFGEEIGLLVSHFKLPDDAVRVSFVYFENTTWIQTEELTDLNKPEMAYLIDGSTNDVGELKVSVYS